jgi:hypothetical protein
MTMVEAVSKEGCFVMAILRVNMGEESGEEAAEEQVRRMFLGEEGLRGEDPEV